MCWAMDLVYEKTLRCSSILVYSRASTQGRRAAERWAGEPWAERAAQRWDKSEEVRVAMQAVSIVVQRDSTRSLHPGEAWSRKRPTLKAHSCYDVKDSLKNGDGKLGLYRCHLTLDDRCLLGLGKVDTDPETKAGWQSDRTCWDWCGEGREMKRRDSSQIFSEEAWRDACSLNKLGKLESGFHRWGSWLPFAKLWVDKSPEIPHVPYSQCLQNTWAVSKNIWWIQAGIQIWWLKVQIRYKNVDPMSTSMRLSRVG